MATGGLTTTPSLDWLWIASKAIFAGSPDFGSTTNLSLTRLLALDRPQSYLCNLSSPLLALDRLQSYLCRLMVELRAENALCRPEIDIIVINQPNRLVMHTPTLWHDRGLA